MHDFMTTREVADYLRIKQRRVYELVRRRAIPCTRVTGKWLFPRALVDIWLAERAAQECGLQGGLAGPARVQAPPVVAGSHDPLLDWAVRESGCGLALLPGGSLDGLKRFAGGEAQVAGLHLWDAASETFNLPAVSATLPLEGLLLIQWAWRSQGLVLAAGNPAGVTGLEDLAGKRVTVIGRQPAAGSHLLLAQLLERANLAPEDLDFAAETAGNETDLGLAILKGRAQAGLAVEAVARALKLDFLPLLDERYDLLLRRRDYFEPPFQALLAFARTEPFRARAAQMGGYDITSLGQVELNGP